MAIIGAFAVAPLVSACAAGQHPQSVMPTRLTEGVNASVGQIAVRNAFVLGPEPGQRLPVGASAPLYAWIVVRGTSADKLVGVDAPGVAQSVEIANGGVTLPPNQLISTNSQATPQQSGVPTPGVTPSGTPTKGTVKKGTPAKPGSPSGKPTGTPGAPSSPATSGSPSVPSTGGTAAGTTPTVILKGLTKEFSGGESIRLTLHFQQAGAVDLDVPVVPRAGSYATYPAAPSGGTTSTPAGTPSPGTPAPGTTPGASTTPGVSKSPAAGAATPAGKSGKHVKGKKASAPPAA
jgi:copper(I)-binding protein